MIRISVIEKAEAALKSTAYVSLILIATHRLALEQTTMRGSVDVTFAVHISSSIP